MSKKTALAGGEFGDDWQGLLALLVALSAVGLAPKAFRPAIAAAATAATVYKIAKWLGLI